MSQQYQINVQIDDEYLEYFDGRANLTQNTLSAAAIATLKSDTIERGIITIVLTNDDEVQALNRAFLGVDSPTDVLSFPSQNKPQDELNADDPHTSPKQLVLPPELAVEQAAYLGDLVIALPYTKKQADQQQRTLTEEISLLVVHGTLHLLGYDHLTVEEEREMWKTQAEILGTLGMVVPVESRAD